MAAGPEIAWIDTIDVCHLECPTCIRGVRGMQNTPRKMPLEMFEQIVAKVKTERYGRIGLYNWTEPFLNRTLELCLGRETGRVTLRNLNYTLVAAHRQS